jgi:uncharacterized coiled-coil protein SlyX
MPGYLYIPDEKKQGAFKNTIDELSGDLEQLQSDLDLNQRKVGELSEDLVIISKTVLSQQKQLNLILGREEALRDSFASATSAYQQWSDEKSRNLRAIG